MAYWALLVSWYSSMRTKRNRASSSSRISWSFLSSSAGTSSRSSKSTALAGLGQQASAEVVEGAHRHAAVGDERLDALAHLAGGLVGEGDGEDVVGPHPLAQQPGDAARDDARLTAAGAGEDEQGPLIVR